MLTGCCSNWTLTPTQQKAQQFFDDVLEYKDVEKNGEGEVALHGVTYLAWTSKVPA